MGGQWRKENPNPRVHRSGGKLGEPRFPLEQVDPRVGIFLSPLTTHDGFYLSILIYINFTAKYKIIGIFFFVPTFASQFMFFIYFGVLALIFSIKLCFLIS